MILIDAENVKASRPNRPLFADISVTVSGGDRLGVVGLNGCGKSTLLRMLAGELEPESGVVRRGRGARIGMLGQSPSLPAGTVRDAVGNGWRGESMLDSLGMTALLDRDTAELSGGQRKRVALAALLVRECDGLILDEPTNHLDLDAIGFLEEWLAAFTGGLVLVTHDRHVLDRVTTRVLEIDRGRGYLHVPQGWNAGSGYAAYLAGRTDREEQAAAAEQVRRNLARTELEWLRRGAPARTSKPKARVDAARALVNTRPEAAARPGDLELRVGSQRLGSKGVEILGVGFEWPDGQRVLRPFDHVLEPGDRLGIVGPNGAGKSTLLDLVAGRLSPTEGRIDTGRTVRVGYYDQNGRELDQSVRVRDAVAGDKGVPSLDDVNLMKRFWFDGDAQFAEIGLLSGGERRRLQLLLTLVEQPNVLLLDEPTNDLDLDTLRALEDFLDDWPGIVVVVSHDRAFLDRTVTEVLALDGSGGARMVRGGVDGWLRERVRPPVPPAPVGKPQPGTSTAVPKTAVPKTAKSPSTIRRLVAQATREIAASTGLRDALSAELSAVAASGGTHTRLADLGERLAAAQSAVDAAEEMWMSLAAEAEARGIELEDT